MDLIISIQEARKTLGKKAETMSDEQIAKLIQNLDYIATHAIRDAREKRMKEDASELANIIYDLHRDNRDKK